MSNELNVKTARSSLTGEDLSRIHELMKHLTSRTIEEKSLERRLTTIISNNHSHLYLARHAGEIMGMATLTIKVIPVETSGYIDDVVVDPNSPVPHVGSALMGAIVEEADRRQISLNLSSRPERERAIALYEKFGFITRDSMLMRRLPEEPTRQR